MLQPHTHTHTDPRSAREAWRLYDSFMESQWRSMKWYVDAVSPRLRSPNARCSSVNHNLRDVDKLQNIWGLNTLKPIDTNIIRYFIIGNIVTAFRDKYVYLYSTTEGGFGLLLHHGTFTWYFFSKIRISTGFQSGHSGRSNGISRIL